MKTLLFQVAVICLAAAHLPLFAQLAPGEDPVVMTRKIGVNMLPMNQSTAKATGMDSAATMPAWMKARVARYESKAYSGTSTDILTDSDVVTSASAAGLKKACVQEIGSTTTAAGSNSAFSQYGPKGAAQIVVLKGDLVNICN